MGPCSSAKLRVLSSLAVPKSSVSFLPHHSACLPKLPLPHASFWNVGSRHDLLHVRSASSSSSAASVAAESIKGDSDASREQSSPSTSTYSFAAAAAPSSSTSVQRQPGTDYLTSLCDQAIHFSRDVSFSDNLVIIRQRLADAIVVLRQLLDTHQKHGGKGKDLSYEISIVRAAFLQVVRTLRALNGKETALMQAQILGDHYAWEVGLIKAGISELVDESIATFTIRTHKDIAYTPATDIVRTSSVLCEITDDLTFPSEDRLRSRRGFPSVEARQAMVHLWSSVKRIPLWAWDLPVLVEGDYENGGDAVFHTMKQHVKALLESKRFAEAVLIWEDSARLFGPSSRRCYALSNLLGNHLRAYRKMTHSLHVNGRSTMSDGTSWLSCFYDYARGLRRLALLLEAGGMQAGDEVVGGRSMKPLLKPRNTIVRSIALLELSRGRSGTEKESRSNVQGAQRIEVVNAGIEAKGASESLRRWITTWLGDPSLAPHLSVKTYNTLVAMLLHRDAHPKPSPKLAMSILKRMSREGPKPDTTTINVLLHHANELRDKPLLAAVIRLAIEETNALQRKQQQEIEAQNREHSEGSAIHEIKDSAPSVNSWIWLLEGGLLSNDTYRLTALLKIITTHGLYQKLYIGRSATSVLKTGVSPTRIIFALYPSLDLRRRAAFLRKRLRSIANPKEPPAAFEPRTLTMALHLLVLSRKTGLAERVWKLMKRASKRSKGTKDMDEGWRIPIEAYTSMMKLWAVEAGYSRMQRSSLNIASEKTDENGIAVMTTKKDSTLQASNAVLIESRKDTVAAKAQRRPVVPLRGHRLRAPRGRTIPISALYVRGWFDETSTGRSRASQRASPMLRAHAAVVRAREAYLALRARWYESAAVAEPSWEEEEGDEATLLKRAGLGEEQAERPDAIFMRAVINLLERADAKDTQDLCRLVREDVHNFGLEKQVKLARLPDPPLDEGGKEAEA